MRPETDASHLTKSLGGRWRGSYGTAPCPVCQRERRRGQNALTLAQGRDGRLLAHRKRGGCDFRDILAAAGIAPGLTGTTDFAELARPRREAEADAARRAAQAWTPGRTPRPSRAPRPRPTCAAVASPAPCHHPCATARTPGTRAPVACPRWWPG